MLWTLFQPEFRVVEFQFNLSQYSLHTSNDMKSCQFCDLIHCSQIFLHCSDSCSPFLTYEVHIFVRILKLGSTLLLWDTKVLEILNTLFSSALCTEQCRGTFVLYNWCWNKAVPLLGVEGLVRHVRIFWRSLFYVQVDSFLILPFLSPPHSKGTCHVQIHPNPRHSQLIKLKPCNAYNEKQKPTRKSWIIFTSSI